MFFNFAYYREREREQMRAEWRVTAIMKEREEGKKHNLLTLKIRAIMKKSLLLILGVVALSFSANALNMKATGTLNEVQKATRSGVVSEWATYTPTAAKIADATDVQKFEFDQSDMKANKIRRKAAEDVITEQPAGELKQYTRAGSYIGSDGYIHGATGFVDIVFDEDGETVWIKDIVSSLAFGSWVKGTIATVTSPRGDYQVINVPMGQVLYSHPTYGDFKLGITYPSASRTAEGNLVFRINGNTLTLQTYTSYSVGVVGFLIDFNGTTYASNNLGLAYGDYAIAFTLFEEPETTAVPAGLEFTDYPFSANKDASEDYSATVGVAWDNADVYVKGIIPELPDAVIKGTLANDTITFPVQYLGKDENTPYFFGGYSSMGGVPNVRAAYDSENDIIKFVGSVMILGSATNSSSVIYFYNGGIIGTAPEALELPEGLTYETLPYVTNEYDFTAQSFANKVTKIDVAFDDANNKIYLRGLLTNCTEGWLVGTINGTTVTFDPQFAGKDSRYGSGNYFVGYNTTSSSVQSMTFNYDAANKYMYSREYFGALDNMTTLNGWYSLQAYAYIGAYDEEVNTITADNVDYYATFFDDTYNRQVPANTTIYAATLSETKDYLDLVEIEGDTIPAGVPVILKTNSAIISLPATVSEGPAVSANDLTVNEAAIDADSIAKAPLFILGIDSEKVGFVLNNSAEVAQLTVNIPASAAAEGAAVLPFGKPESIMIGDVNGDNQVNVGDVVALAEYVSSGSAPEGFVIEAANVNGDEQGVDVSDVVALANKVMGE